MDSINQLKLKKEEWEAIEKPCNLNDKFVLEFLNKSYENPDYIIYKYQSLNCYLKINDSNYDGYIFQHILQNYVEKLEEKFNKLFKQNQSYITCKSIIKQISSNKKSNCKKVTLIKIESSSKKVQAFLDNISFKVKETKKMTKKNKCYRNKFIYSSC